MERPLLTGSFLFILGIILARFFTSWVTLWLVLAGASFFAALFCAFVQRTKGEEESRKGLTFLLLLCLVFLGGLWYSLSRSAESALPAKFIGETVEGEGTISSYPRENAYGISFQLQIDQIYLDNGKKIDIEEVMLKGPTGLSSFLSPGDRVFFRGIISLPQEARNPGEFNYREYLANRGVFQFVNCQKGELRLLEQVGGIRALAAAGRRKVVEHLRTILPQREQGLILGTLFGETTLMENGEWDAYQRTGIVHLFSVSGLHVGIILGVVWFILSFWRPRPFVRLLVGAFVLFGYILLVGESSAIIRASLMAVLGLLALVTGRKYDFYNALGAAAWIILLLSPGELFQPGFQFSFVTTAGMVYLTPWLIRKGYGKILSPALAAQVVSTPITAFYFNQVSIIAPLVNLLAVAVSGIAAILSFIGTFFTWFLPFLATPFFVVTGALFYCLSEFVIWCAELPWASIWVASPSPLLVSCIYLGIVLIPVLPRYRYILREIPRRLRLVFICFLAVMLLLACWPFPKEMEVVFLDVGQGDSIFIRTPGGKTILLDGGGTPGSTYSLGENVLIPLLAHYGVNKIDLMIMSHNHVDHCEGLLEILPRFRVGTFFMPPAEGNNEMEQALADTCAENNIPIQVLTDKQKIVVEEDVVIEVFHPEEANPLTGNNRSLVFRLNYRNNSWLFTGDIEKEALGQLHSAEVSLRANILKIPHHGSRTSFDPAFYGKVQPGAVVISVGEKNNFGQPHPDVCAYFQSRGIPVYLTMEGGAVITRSNGEKVVVHYYLSP